MKRSVATPFDPLRLLTRLLFLALVALTSACGGDSEGMRGEVVSRLPRPGGTEEALVTEDSGNATTGSVKRVFISYEHGTSTDLVMTAEAALHVRWVSADTLEITYPCGRIYKFTNFTRRYLDSSYEKQIHVVLNTAVPLRCS